MHGKGVRTYSPPGADESFSYAYMYSPGADGCAVGADGIQTGAGGIITGTDRIEKGVGWNLKGRGRYHNRRVRKKKFARAES
jgi:hypothetical protein